MRKISLLFLVGILMVCFVSAVPDLEVKKIDKGSVIIKELDNPAIFEFVINNKGEADQFEIYSLVGVTMSPKGKFDLPEGETRMEVKANPFKETRERFDGLFSFEYQMRGWNSGIFRDHLTIKVVPLKDVIEIIPRPLYLDDSSAMVTVRNKENTQLQNLEIEFDSMFFSGKEIISLEPYVEVNVSLEVDEGSLEGVVAGPYIVNAKVDLEGKKAEFEGILNYLEQEGVFVNEVTEGLIVRKKTIEKVNEGNTVVTATVEIKKDIVSRLFTINLPSPVDVERRGLFVKYVWEKDISPGESFVVESTTNYTFPFIVLILIIFIAVMAKIYLQTAVTLKKNVSLVRTKGGEFALKVSLRVKAVKHVDKVQIIDSLPAMTKIYERFGRKPDRIDEKSKRLFWNIEKLTKGEERVYSYIIYSKLRVIGRFELPAATAVFEREGRMQEAWSNKTFFVSGESE